MVVTQKELGERLRKAREAAGLTQEEAAAELNLSRSGISQMETGDRSVSSIELSKLAYLFGRDITEFLSAEFDNQDSFAALYRANPDMIETKEVMDNLRACMLFAREQSNLEDILEIDRNWNIASYPSNLPVRKWGVIKQGERVAEQERRRLGIGYAPIENLPELLDSEGIRTRQADLPDDISGFTMNDPNVGPFIVINKNHAANRKRYSYAHEYAHVLMDCHTLGLVSRESKRAELVEVRANAFAAAFLMPERGIRQYLAGIGKDKVQRAQTSLYDESGVVPIDVRPTGKREISLYNVIQLAHHFGVSKLSVIYRLLNLRIVSQNEHEHLLEEDRRIGAKLARYAELDMEPHDVSPKTSVHRFLGLALEALRRDEISEAKFKELVSLCEMDGTDLSWLIEETEVEA